MLLSSTNVVSEKANHEKPNIINRNKVSRTKLSNKYEMARKAM